MGFQLKISVQFLVSMRERSVKRWHDSDRCDGDPRVSYVTSANEAQKTPPTSDRAGVISLKCQLAEPSSHSIGTAKECIEKAPTEAIAWDEKKRWERAEYGGNDSEVTSASVKHISDGAFTEASHCKSIPIGYSRLQNRLPSRNFQCTILLQLLARTLIKKTLLNAGSEGPFA